MLQQSTEPLLATDLLEAGNCWRLFIFFRTDQPVAYGNRDSKRRTGYDVVEMGEQELKVMKETACGNSIIESLHNLTDWQFFVVPCRVALNSGQTIVSNE